LQIQNDIVFLKSNENTMKRPIIILFISLLGFIKMHAQVAPAFPDKMSLSENVNIAGTGSGEIEKDILLNSKGLTLNGKSPSASKITSFRMTLVEMDGSAPKEFFNEVNGEMTPAMIDAIKNAPAGSKLFFEYIKCSGANKTTRTLHPASFILK
jgi:hypothetical protein